MKSRYVPQPIKKALASAFAGNLTATARYAWSLADYDEVLRLLRDNRSPEGRALLAQTFLRLSDPQRALDALRGPTPRDPNDAALLATLRAAASQRLGTGHERHRFPALPPRARREVRGAYAYYRAASLWAEGALDEAYVSAAEAIDHGDENAALGGLEVQAQIEISRRRYPVATRRLIEMLNQFSAEGPIDEYRRATSIRSLALVAVETLDSDVFPRLFAEWETLRPASATRRIAVGIATYLANAKELQGDENGCFELLLEARSIPAPEPFPASVDIDLAAFHYRRGSTDAATRHLKLAQQRLEATNWAGADIEARALLLQFASEAAALQPEAAASAFAKALSLAGRRDPALAFDRDERTQALAYLARGRIAMSRNRQLDALKDVRRAFELFEGFGYRYHAALAALDLVRLREVSGPAKVLQEVSRDFPRSWLAAEVQHLNDSFASPFASITAAERRVLERICEGKTSRQIAAELDRSPSTIRNQTISIYRTLGVNTRSALVATVAREQSIGNPLLSPTILRPRTQAEPTPGRPSDEPAKRGRRAKTGQATKHAKR